MIFSFGYGQKTNSVTWKTVVEKISDKEFILSAEATIISSSHLYSQNVPGKSSVATTFMFDDSEGGFSLLGNTTEEEGRTIEDPILKTTTKVFEKKLFLNRK